MCLMGASCLAVNAEEPADSSINLKAQGRLGEVVVTGTRSAGVDARQAPNTVTQIGREQIEARLSPSLLDVVGEQTPGLFFTQRGVLGYGVGSGGAGGLSIRGIGSSASVPQAMPVSGVMVLVDGHPQYMGIMGHPLADACQSLLAEKVEVVRGPASMLYGSNAMGGVVNIVTRRMERDGTETRAQLAGGSYGTLTAEATNRTRLGRFCSVASASYSRTDGHRARMGFDQAGGYLKLGYRLGSAWEAYADAQFTHFNSQTPGTVSEPMEDYRQHVSRGVASVELRNNYGALNGGLSLFLNWGDHKINDGYALEGGTPLDYRYRSRDHVGGLNLYETFALWRGNRTTVGFDWQNLGGHAWDEYLDSRPDEQLVDTALTSLAGYVDLAQDLGSAATLQAGLRYDHHSVAGGEWVPRLGAAFHLPQALELKLSVAKGFRYPTTMDLFLFTPRNAGLKAERIWNYELALSQPLWGGRAHYGVNLFYLYGDNLITVNRIDGRPVRMNTNKVENFGLELAADCRLGRHFALNANYSYLRQSRHLLATPRHKLYAEGTYAAGRLAATLGCQWVGHLLTQIATQSQPERHDSYVLLSARAAYRVAQPVRLFLRGENLLAQRYEINAGYPMPKATFTGGVQLQF